MNNLLAILLLVVLVSCQNNSTTKQTDSTNSGTTSSQPAATTTSVVYPSIPLETIQNVFKKTDYIDYVFYELPFSMNHGKKSDIQNAIRYISTTPLTSDLPQCASIGRIFYQAEGKILTEAEFHFNEERKCFYLVFLEDGKPAYSNLLTTTGMKNYSNIFAQVSK